LSLIVWVYLHFIQILVVVSEKHFRNMSA